MVRLTKTASLLLALDSYESVKRNVWELKLGPSTGIIDVVGGREEAADGFKHTRLHLLRLPATTTTTTTVCFPPKPKTKLYVCYVMDSMIHEYEIKDLCMSRFYLQPNHN